MEYSCSLKDELIENGTISSKNSPSCQFLFLGSKLDTTSFANFVTALSVFIQAFLYISVASFGDYGSWRKKLLVNFAIIGILSCLLMPLAYKPSLYWVAALVVMSINIFQGVSYVFLDGFFPLLCRNDPQVRHEKVSFEDRGNAIQAFGFVTGNITGISFLALTLLILSFFPQNQIMVAQVMVAVCGIWWLAWVIFAIFNLQPRPGPPLPDGQSNYVLFSWITVWNTICKWRQIPNTFIFLGSFFMYTDALHTLAQEAILFCTHELNMSVEEALIIGIVFPISGIVGNISLLYFQRLFKISTKGMLFGLLLVLTLIPCYPLIGIVSDRFGLVHKWEAYLIACTGFIFGPVMSFGKVLFAEIIPEGSESEFFALAAIVDRGSSWIGPILVGSVTNALNIRYGMASISILFIIGLPLLYMVDVKKGIRDARAYASHIKEDSDILFDD